MENKLAIPKEMQRVEFDKIYVVPFWYQPTQSENCIEVHKVVVNVIPITLL